MQSWSSLLGEALAGGDRASGEEMLRRFVEATRRAEIIALVNSTSDEHRIGELVATELCEAFEAETAFVIAVPAGGEPELVGAVGLAGTEANLLADPVVRDGLALDRAEQRAGSDLLGLGATVLALAPFEGRGGRTLVAAARHDPAAFDAAEIALLEAVTTSVGHALERAWLSRQRDRQAAREAALARAARLLNASLDLPEVIATLCRELCGALSCDGAAVHLTDDRGQLTTAAEEGSPRGDAALVARAMETGEGIIGERSIAVPLIRGSVVDGVIEARWGQALMLGDDELAYASAFAELASGACRNAERHEAARRAAAIDSLTGCLNHAAFQTRLREEISRAERGSEPFTLALLDLDDFKQVNERHGHLAGDSVLRAVGDSLRQTLRFHDQIARFGGDEFALLLPATDRVTAQAIVDRALVALGETPLPSGDMLGARAGVAAWTWGDQATSLLERADLALRAAKRAGSQRRVDDVAVGEVPQPVPAALSDPERRARRLAVVGELGAKLSRMLDATTIAATAVADARRGLDYSRCAILRAEGDGPAEIAVAGDVDGQADLGEVERCLNERRPVLVDSGEGQSLSRLIVPLYVGAELWGVIDVSSPLPAAFDAVEAQLLQRLADHVGAALRSAGLYEELEQTYVGTASALANALEAKDNYTHDHAMSIARLAVAVGRRLGLEETALRDLRYGAIFHDIGKIAIPDAILHKPSELDDDERTIMERHPIVGEQILAPVPFLSGVREIVRHDHERWDGAGYPDGLHGDAIPIGARIVLVVDAYHAMTSDRPYRLHLSEADAREQLRTGAGSQFDPGIVDAFLAILDDGGEPGED